MSSPTLRRSLLLIAIGWSSLAPLNAGTKIPLGDVPGRVRDAIRKQFANAALISAERGDERNDYVYFTVVLQDGKSTRSVTVTELGEIVETPR